FAAPDVGRSAFRTLWIVAALSFVFITGLTLLLDPVSGRHSWREAVLYPGLVSLSLIVYALFPGPVVDLLTAAVGPSSPATVAAVTLAIYAWPALSLAGGWLAKVVETRPGGRWLSPLLVYLVGYGPLLCTMTLAAYAKELRRAESTWEKTEKTGRAMS